MASAEMLYTARDPEARRAAADADIEPSDCGAALISIAGKWVPAEDSVVDLVQIAGESPVRSDVDSEQNVQFVE